MPRITLDDDVICMTCNEFLIQNPDRCGDMNCDCHQVKYVHMSTSSDECEQK